MSTNFFKMVRYYISFLVVLSVSLNAENTINPRDCIFSSVLGTRGNPSKITMKDTGDTGYLDNTTECTLNTFSVYSDSSGHGLSCNGGTATATGSYEDALTIDYDYTLETPNTNQTPGNNSSKKVKTNNSTLTNNKYKNITQNWHLYSFTWSPNGNDIGVNKFKGMLNTVTIDNIGGKDLKIGQFIAKTYNNTTLHLTAIPKNIQIYKMQTSGSNNFTTQTASNPGLEAANRIDIQTLSLKSSQNTDLTLKAPTVVIGKMDLNNDKNHITIYADEIDIDEIDFGQDNTLTIHPYTAGKKVKFYSRQLNISSSTQMLWDSGDYYVDDFEVSGSGKGKSFVNASGPDQIINLFINRPGNNHDFEIDSNWGINSNGVGGDYGSNPAQNFRIFVNGDVTTGDGGTNNGTTFNAYIYAEGEADLGSSTYIKGALSTKKDVTIADGSHFEPADENGGWGACATSATSVTYDNQYSCGLFDNVLTSYAHITSNGNNDQACYTANISYPAGEIDGDIQCSVDACTGTTSSCHRQDPPKNKYTHSFPTNSKSGSANGSNPTELTDLEYGNLTYSNETTHFNPSQTYSDNNNVKVMLLGDVTLSKSTLRFEPGDYYFDSLTISGNNNKVELPNNGDVRIFIKNDFSVAMNNLDFNTDGNQNDLFVYVGGDFKSLSNGGGTTSWKAYMYVKGTTTLKNNSNNWKIYGGITSEGEVTIDGNNPDFIQQGNKGKSFGYGECQLCYESDPSNHTGLSMMGMSIMTTTVTPIINNSSETIRDVSVEESFNGNGMQFGKNLDVQDQDGNHVNGSSTSDNSDKLFLMSHGGGTNLYDFGNGDYPPSDGTTYYQTKQSSLFSFSGFQEWADNIRYVAKYTDTQDREYEIILNTCQETPIGVTSYITGPFDAWDTFRDNTSTPPTDRNISTKIVNTTFSLSLASLNKTNDAYEIKQGIGDINVSIYPNGSLTPISNSVLFDANTTDHNSSVNFNVTKADRNASVGFKLCATYQKNVTTGKEEYLLYPQATCSTQSAVHECNATTSGTPTWHICYSTDNFAIRPYSFRTFGKKQYKLAGEDFNITIKGVDQNNNDKSSGHDYNVTGVSDYNASLSDLNITSHFYQPSNNDIKQMNKDVYYRNNDTDRSTVAHCPNAGIFTINNSSDSFTNGNVNTSLKFSETGILDLNISEIPGHEWALVDADDTNDTQRYIKPATVIFDNIDISKINLLLFAPYKFDTTVQYKTTNGKNWLYMHDINGSNHTFSTPEMAAYIEYTITAKNKDGAITQNNTKTCFPDTSDDHCPTVNGLKLNTTIDLFLDADINSSADANISLYTENNNSSAIYTPLKNKSLHAGNNSIREWISPVNFYNGVGKAKAYFNIDRNISITRNPITIGVRDANTSTSWMDNAGSPKEFNGIDLNQSKTFYYGRTHAPIQRFATPSAKALIYYEIYCNGASCDKTLLPDGVNSKITDDPRWFINTQHTLADGHAFHVTQKGDSVVTTTTEPSGNAPDSAFILYDATKGYPYKTTMENNASNWLIYNKYNPNAKTNESQVEFINASSSWSGAHETNTTTLNGGSSITNRRLMW